MYYIFILFLKIYFFFLYILNIYLFLNKKVELKKKKSGLFLYEGVLKSSYVGIIS